MDSEVLSWLQQWFQSNAGVETAEIQKGLGDNYFELGWIDSFKFISFISDIEEHFNVQFSNDEFQDRGFASINGLTTIIAAKRNSTAQ
jgi:acyl carrier protein